MFSIVVNTIVWVSYKEKSILDQISSLRLKGYLWKLLMAVLHRACGMSQCGGSWGKGVDVHAHVCTYECTHFLEILF